MPVMLSQDVARNLLLAARTIAKLTDAKVSDVLLTLVLELAKEKSSEFDSLEAR